MNRININGPIWCAQGALKTMKNYKDGRIINFASKSGKTGSAHHGGLLRRQGRDHRGDARHGVRVCKNNIKVNCLCPGIVEKTGVWGAVSKGYVENLKMEEARW